MVTEKVWITKKVWNFIGLTLTFLGMILGIYNLINAETILSYILSSLLTLLCFGGFIAFLYDIKKKGEK